jgi:hypothetical protein
MAAYQFPLARQDQYKGQIVFRAIEVPPIDASAVTQGLQQARAAAEQAVENAVGDARPSAQDVSQFKGGTEGSQTRKRTIQQGNSRDFVTLYMPQAIQVRDGVVYDNADLGLTGGAIERGMQSGGGALSGAFSAIKADASAFIDTFIGGGGGSVAALRASRFFGDEVQGAVRSALRVTPNPNTRALFRSVPLREFTFQFRLTPESPKESEQIKEIIKWFRTELYPENINVEGFSVGYKFPNPIDIKILYDGQLIPEAKILPAYLRDVTASYNTQGMSFYQGGDWTSVDLSLSFMETIPFGKKDIA